MPALTAREAAKSTQKAVVTPPNTATCWLNNNNLYSLASAHTLYIPLESAFTRTTSLITSLGPVARVAFSAETAREFACKIQLVECENQEWQCGGPVGTGFGLPAG